METRKCTGCKIEKSEGDFFKKRDGRETVCKVCKKANRNAREKADCGAASTDREASSPPPINTDHAQTHPFVSTDSVTTSALKTGKWAHIEPDSSPDFSLWEQKYGRPLSDSDKIEIKANLRDLFTLLKEEWPKKPAAKA
jgi:CRISPR/Cas system-associated protein Cas10 (large subunit of type III CRISPR-Cas system)